MSKNKVVGSELQIDFVDNGQDFLRWVIRDGLVVSCEPFQGWVWEGKIVLNESIQAGDQLVLMSQGKRKALNHQVERVKFLGKT